MADPFTDVAVSGYNANPPADDGSEVDSNEITWAGIKTKLGDPLNTAFASLVTNIGTAVDKLSHVSSTKSGNYTILAADQGKVLIQTGSAKTFTTPAAATVSDPFVVFVLNQSSDDTPLTIDGNASETVNGALTIDVAAGTGGFLFTDGTNWFFIGQQTARLDQENQPLTGGATVTSKALSAVSGVVTVDVGDCPLQHYDNVGAFSLEPGAATGSCLVDITNDPSGGAGAVTTSAFDHVVGGFTTTSGDKFRCHVSVGDAGSLLSIQVMQ